MESNPQEDCSYMTKRKLDDTDGEDNYLTKRKLEDTEGEVDGTAIKRSKATLSGAAELVEGENEQYNLLNFSDDVLLYILQYCSPLELKALSFCCRRLARLCMDRSLWRIVELRHQASGFRALSFYANCLRSSTNSFYIRGLIGSGSARAERTVKDTKNKTVPIGCECLKSDFIGNVRRNVRRHILSRFSNSGVYVNNSDADDEVEDQSEDKQKGGPSQAAGDLPSRATNREDEDAAENNRESQSDKNFYLRKLFNNSDGQNDAKQNQNEPGNSNDVPPFDSNEPGPSSYTPKNRKETGNTSPKPFSINYENYPPLFPNDKPEKEKKPDTPQVASKSTKRVETADCCLNKAFCLATITKEIMMQVKDRCHNLSDLRLEFCNLDCNSFMMTELPKSLKVLSLRGCSRTNKPFQKSFLFNIQDHVPQLEELDLSYCYWLSGHSLLLLSKLKCLRKLWLRGCEGLGECVAYASLSTRFGFKTLELLDIRGTSMGDSEVSGFGSLDSLRELYLEPPEDREQNPVFPAGWPEHTGLMEPWETMYPCNEVEDYIKSMNKEEIGNREPKKPAESEVKVEAEPPKTSNDNRRSDRPNRERIGVIYSVVNLSYEGRVAQDENQAQQNNDNPNPEPPPNADREDPPENEGDNQMGIQVGRVGVQVGPLGVHVGPLRLQMRQRPDVQPEGGDGQPGMGGVQVGPVEVQVGPDGVQVGLGGVRVEPRWVRGGAEEMQVNLGEVHVEPDWMHFGADGVQVDFGGVQVGPVEVQLGQEQNQAPENARENPVEVQMGPIEVQVGAVRVEVAHDGRQMRMDVGNNAGPNQPPPRQQERPDANHPRPGEPNRNPGARIPGERMRRMNFGEVPMEFADVEVNPIWMRVDGGNDNAHERMMDMGPVGVHVHLRHANPRMGPRPREREPAENPNRRAASPPMRNPWMFAEHANDNRRPIIAHRNVDPARNNQNDQQPDAPRRNIEQRRNHLMNWLQFQPEGMRVGIMDGQGPRAYLIAPEAGPDVQPNDARNAENRLNQEAQREPPVCVNRANPEPPRERVEENRENPPERRNEPEPRIPRRPSYVRRHLEDLEEHLRFRWQREQPRQEAQHNIMDGRVHVIYVDPRYPRRPAAEVLVAAGMPRNAEAMAQDENAWLGGRPEDYRVREIFNLPFVPLPFFNVGGNMRHINGFELVTDVSLLRLGESEQLVHVGAPPGRRRKNSNLEVLICRGFRGVTDQSLLHLAIAAPNLRILDVQDCGVTPAGVASFSLHRPDCKLHHNADQLAERSNEAPQ